MYSRCLDTNNGELLCFVYLEKDDLEKYKQAVAELGQTQVIDEVVVKDRS